MTAADTAVTRAAELVDRLARLADGEDYFGSVVALGDDAVPALEALLCAPPDAVFEHRARAAAALAAIGSVAAVAALRRGLHEAASRRLDGAREQAEAAVVTCTALRLAEAAGPAAADDLLAVLARRCDPGCCEALGRLADARALPRLIECLVDGYARGACLRAVERFGAAAGPPLAALIERGAADEGDLRASARAAALTLLLRLDPPLALPLARRKLVDPQPAVRLAAACGLAPHGAPARTAEELVAALGGDDWNTAEVAGRALAVVGVRGLAALARALRQRPPYAHAPPAALRRARRSAPLLAGCAHPRAAALFEVLLSAGDAGVRRAALRAMARRDDAWARARLRQALHDADAEVRQRAALLLVRRGDYGELPACLADADAELRRQVAAHLRAAVARGQLLRWALCVGHLPLRARLRLLKLAGERGGDG